MISPSKAERHPWEMFFIGVVYSTVSILLSLWLFKEYAGIVMIFLTTLLCAPMMYGTIILEERKNKYFKKEMFLLKEHYKALSFFMFLFLGFVVSFSLWYVFYPNPEIIFGVELNTMHDLTGNAINAITGNAVTTTPGVFNIFFSNLKILLLCLLFSFIFGIGAILILTWNAAIMGVAIGSFINYPAGLLRYLLHGIPEMFAYFMAGLGMGIISVAVTNRDWRSREFRHIVVDSIDLILLSVFMLFLGTLIEVYITPLLNFY